MTAEGPNLKPNANPNPKEQKMPLVGGEGPFGLIICPSRELAKQTYDSVVDYCESLTRVHQP